MKLTLWICLMISTSVLAAPFDDCIAEFFPHWIPANSEIDAMQALDSSGSVGATGFAKGNFAARRVNRAINGLTNGITGVIPGTRSGYIQFASLDNTDIRIHLPDHTSLSDLNDDIRDNQAYTGGFTALAKALKKARQEFYNNSDSSRIKRVMLITDGYDNQQGDPVHEARVLKEKMDVEICVATIGQFNNMELLKEVATEYGIDHEMKPCICGASSWDDLKKGIINAIEKLKPIFRQRRKKMRKLRKGARSA